MGGDVAERLSKGRCRLCPGGGSVGVGSFMASCRWWCMLLGRRRSLVVTIGGRW